MNSERPSDVIVIGGGFAGCLTAMACADRGLTTVLVERRAYLGREVTAKLRPWIGRAGENELSDELRGLIIHAEESREIDVDPADVPACYADELPLFRGSI